MVVLRNRKNTQEHQVAFTQAKAKAKAAMLAEAEAEAEAEAKAKATKVQDWIVASAEAKAKAKADAEAHAKAKADAKLLAATLQELNLRANEILAKQTVGLITATKLIDDYRTHGFPVPSFLIDTVINGLKRMTTIVYPEVKPVATTKPCQCSTNFRYGQDAWFDEHLRSGKCTAYKMYQVKSPADTATAATTATEPFANEPKRTTQPCECEEYDRWSDHAWYEIHVGSGKCTAYKPWI